MDHKLTRIAILYGGKSVEHQISINSARNLFHFIDKTIYEPILIGISKEGRWFLSDSLDTPIESGKALTISLGESPNLLLASGQVLNIDMVFPILHGTNGEDGSIQGLLQVLNLPMVGTGVLGSAMCMSKLISKQIMELYQIPTARFFSYHRSQRESINFDFLSNELGVPMMVKSANLGSSVGISKVRSATEFAAALEESFRFDHSVLIEAYIEGREIECAVMGNENPIASNPGEIIVSEAYEFYTFDAKYVDGEAVKIDVPAKLDAEVKEQIRKACLKAYQALKCEDFARVDIFLTQDGKFYLNEINTIPGFTNSSMFPMMWKERGISFTDLISRLINYAEVRVEKSGQVETVFNSKLD